MEARWPWEERKPNVAELEVCVVFDERKCSNQERWIFNVILSARCFYIIYGKEIPKIRTSFFQNTMNFESSFINFGNIFFLIPGNSSDWLLTRTCTRNC